MHFRDIPDVMAITVPFVDEEVQSQSQNQTFIRDENRSFIYIIEVKNDHYDRPSSFPNPYLSLLYFISP